MNNQTQTKQNLIKTIVISIAFLVGIVMSSIGGVMFISSFSKLFLFDHNPYYMDYEMSCRHDDLLPMVQKLSDSGEKEVKIEKHVKTEEEIQKCIERRKKEEKDRYYQERMQSIVDGISALIVGLILVFSFRKQFHRS